MLQTNYVDLRAAADRVSNGAIIVPEFQTEIVDLVRRAGVLGQRIEYVPATGSPSRFFEQTDIVDGTYANPQAISPTAIDFSGLRVEKSVVIKAIQSQINYGLFDMETVAQQGIFTQLKAKDLKDMVNGILRLRDKGLWTGTDTVSGSQVGAGTTNQYVGVLSQVSRTLTIASGSSIVDGLRTEVAKLYNQVAIAARPTAIYIHPLALDKLEQEVKSSNNAVKFIQTDISDGKAGISVTGISTVAGVLPLIPDPFMTMNASIGATPIAAAPGGQNNYPFAILTEDFLEYHYVGDKNPRVFQLGTVSNLNESYVGIMFGAPVVKYPGLAHTVGAIQF
jgi:hypothetical protein